MSDQRWLTQRNGYTWHATIAVPRKLRSILGKSHLLRSLHTTELHIARQRRHDAIAEFNRIINAARQQTGAGTVMDTAMAWRDTLRRMQPDDPELLTFQEGIKQSTDEIAAAYSPAIAAAFHGVATDTATPLMHYLDHWLAEGGKRGPLTERTRFQYRSTVNQFAGWCQGNAVAPTVEAVTKPVAGSYITQTFISKGVDPSTTNKHVVALSSYWVWMGKRAGIAANPWAGQSQSKRRISNGERNKRPFTDHEMVALLTGHADQELADAMRVAALSGMRLGELCHLTVADCADDQFYIRKSKTNAGVRRVPIHPDLIPIITCRTGGKPATAFLFGGAKRADALSQRFGRYRQSVGVHDQEAGRRHARIDFHSFRRWFITQTRNAGIDQATVAAVVGHMTGNLTDDTYSAGPSLSQRVACVRAVRLPDQKVFLDATTITH